MNEFNINWERVWEFSLIGLPMALVRTLMNKRSRSWDALLANFLGAVVVSPAVGFGVTAWLDKPATAVVEGQGISLVAAGAASLIGVDLIRGILNLGEHFARDPAGNLTALRNIWTGKGKTNAGD